MEVILLKDVDQVGLRGDVVSVARGYARNYLFPRKLAEEATAARVTELRKREAVEIVAESVQFLGGRGDDAGGNQFVPAAATAEAADFAPSAADDDIPF